MGIAALLVGALLVVTAGSAPTSASPLADQNTMAMEGSPVVTIGVAAALGGTAGFLGWPQANAVQLAVDQTNAAGGIDIGGDTYSVTVLTADSGCNPDGAVIAADWLLNGGAVAVVGHSCSRASGAAQPIYAAAGVPMISPSSSWVGLTDEGYPTTFRVWPRDDAVAVSMATRFRQWEAYDTAALVAMYGYCWATQAFSTTFDSLGGVITSRVTVTSTDCYTDTLTAIQAENPDVVYYVDPDVNNAGLFSATAADLGLDVVAWDITGGGEESLGQYATAAGSAAEEDYIGLSPLRLQDMPGYDALNTAYQAAGFPNFGDEAGLFAAYAYDAAIVVIEAIDRADSTDPADIRDEIAATTDYHGVVGTYEGFDEKGDVIPQWVWIQRYVNGRWVPVTPYTIFLPLTQKNY